MKKSYKRLLALLCVALLALPLLAHPVARAAELVAVYQDWTKYGRYTDLSILLKEPTILNPEILCTVPANESMMITGLWKTDKGDYYYSVLYRNWETGEEIYGYAHPYVFEVQSEPYPWSWARYDSKELYAVKEDNTPWYKTPWQRPENIGGRLDKGHLFRVYTSGANMFDGVRYTDWFRVSNRDDMFINRHDTSYVDHILETKNELSTPLPEAFPKGQTPTLKGMFTTNWPIKNVDITITVGEETVFADKKSNLVAGWHPYSDFFDTFELNDLPARYEAYKLDIIATVAASRWPYPEKVIPIVKDMYFQIYQPATKVSFEHEEITAMPGETFDNPVLMEPDDATYPNYYTLKVEDDTIARVEHGHLTARFTALKEGSTRVFVHATAPNADTSAFFQLTVKRQTLDGLQYRIDGWDATIIGYSPDGDFWLVNVPDRVEGVPVTRIGERAFQNVSNVTHIVLPDSIDSIGESAFCNCEHLESIVIPAGVTSIEERTFQMCKSLSSVTLPAGIISIGEYAFSDCSGLTSITLPASVTNIGDFAFSGCSGLTSITLPANVASISDNAFAQCSGLTSITLPSGLTSIGNAAFADCSKLTSITIPASVTGIGNYAFSNCDSLASVTIPEGVTSIGECAFADCSNLTSITIPKSVTSIGDSAFAMSPVTIHGYLNSKAHQYATDNNIPFVALDAPARLPGDANGDGNLDILDLVSIIDFIVNGTHCKSMENADANGDKTIDIVDLVWIIDKLVGI